jgi:hypothetical protein
VSVTDGGIFGCPNTKERTMSEWKDIPFSVIDLGKHVFPSGYYCDRDEALMPSDFFDNWENPEKPYFSEDVDIDEMYYYYHAVDYEGSGSIIFRKDKKFWTRSFGHCSCNGPLDGIDFNPPTDGRAPFDDLKPNRDMYVEEWWALKNAVRRVLTEAKILEE